MEFHPISARCMTDGGHLLPGAADGAKPRRHTLAAGAAMTYRTPIVGGVGEEAGAAELRAELPLRTA